MKYLMAFGVFMLVLDAVWLVRLGMGLTYLSKDQIPPLIIGGVIGGLGAWYYVPRLLKKQDATDVR